MKKPLGYIAAFVAGTLFSTSAAWAATTFVRAQETTTPIFVGSKLVAHASSLSVGGRTFIQSDAVLGALKVAGVTSAWSKDALVLRPASVGSTTSGSTKGAFTNSSWATVASNAAKYKGKTVDVYGQIFETPQYSGGVTVYQVYLDPANNNEAVLVGVSGQPRLQQGNYIEIKGKIAGAFTGKNSYGGTIIDPMIRASDVIGVTQGQAIDPAIHTIMGIRPFTEYGLTITVTKVSVGHNTVRIHLTAKNKSGANVTIDDSAQDTLVQGSTQLSQSDLYNSGYPSFPTTIADGVVTEDVIEFTGSRSNGGSYTLTIPVTSDNFNQTWKPFVFTFSAKA